MSTPRSNRNPTDFEVPLPEPASRAMDQGEVAKATGISRERVRQIEQKAMRKLKHALARKGIDPSDVFF